MGLVVHKLKEVTESVESRMATSEVGKTRASLMELPLRR